MCSSDLRDREGRTYLTTLLRPSLTSLQEIKSLTATMIGLFKILMTAMLLGLVTLLIDQILKSNMHRSNYLIAATVLCSVLLAAFMWNVAIFSQ